MDTRIVIFLAFVSVTLITNALLLWFVYKGFAGFTLKIVEAARELETRGTTREWLGSLQHASEEAIILTEAAKRRIVEYDARLKRTQSHYGYTLAKIDTRSEKLEAKVSARLCELTGKVQGSAWKIAALVAGMKGLTERLGSSDSE
jgi:hypothetical protein